MTTQTFNAGLAYSEFQTIRVFYIIAACTAFAMSAYFVVGYFAGNLHLTTWDGAQWAQALPSIGLVAVMTAYQFFLYSQGDVTGGRKATIMAVCVAVAFSLLSEIGQGMERDTIRMETKSQESPTYKAAVAALGRLSGGSGIGASPYADDIAAAQKQYNQCLERLARGREPHCNGSKGRLDAYLAQDKAWADRAATTSTNTASTLLGQAKTLERDENNYHPLVKLIRELFFVSGTVGSFLLSLTLISFFEYAFHYLGGRYAQAREKLMQHGYDVTRKLRQPPRRADGSMETYSDQSAPASLLQKAGETVATEYAKAQGARNKVHDQMQKQADQLADKLDKTASSQPVPEQRKPPVMVDGFDMAAVKVFAPTDEEIRTGKSTRQRLREGERTFPGDKGLDTPTPVTAPRMSVADTIRALVSGVQQSGASSPADIQAATQAAYANLSNPADFTPADLHKVAAKIARDLKPAVPAQPVPETPEEYYNAPAGMKFDGWWNGKPIFRDETGNLHQPEPAKPTNQKTSGTGLQNPNLGTSEEQHEMTLPVPTPGLDGIDSRSENNLTPGSYSRSEKPGAPGTDNRALPVKAGHPVKPGAPGLDAELLEAIKDAQGLISADVLKEAAGLYPVWRDQVKSREIKPTKRDGFRFISANLCRGNRARTLTPEHMVMLLNIWQVRAARDAVLKPNPNYANGKAKFLLVA